MKPGYFHILQGIIDREFRVFFLCVFFFPEMEKSLNTSINPFWSRVFDILENDKSVSLHFHFFFYFYYFSFESVSYIKYNGMYWFLFSFHTSFFFR